MQIINKSRRIGGTLSTCEIILPRLKDGEKVFIAGNKYPQNYVLVLKDLGVDVNIEEAFTTQRLEPVYDNLNYIDPQIISFTQKPKKLTGYILTVKQ